MVQMEGTTEEGMGVSTFSLSIAGLLLCFVIAAQSFGFFSSRAELQLLIAIATFYLLVGFIELATLKAKGFCNSVFHRVNQEAESKQRRFLDRSAPACTTHNLHP